MKFNSFLDDIRVYEAGKPIELVVREYGINPEDVIKLASNENPLGTNPLVTEAICKNADKAYLYPDDSMYKLKASLSKRFDVEEPNIIIGSGSDQILEFISHAKLHEGSSVLMSQVTFAMYEIYAKQSGAKVLRTPSYEHKVDEFVDMMDKYNPDIVYICTPNNPTGDATPKEDVLRIIRASNKDTLIVIDAAYIEYASAKDDKYTILPKDILQYENVIYLGTFSKVYGLGGMRVGYGIANRNIIDTLYKMRPPFNITTLSLLAATVANDDDVFVEKSISLCQSQMSRYEDFALEHKIEYIDSYTNFITYIFEDDLDSAKISQYLLERGVIVRNLKSYNMNAIRITIGTKEQNDKLFDLLAKAIK